MRCNADSRAVASGRGREEIEESATKARAASKMCWRWTNLRKLPKNRNMHSLCEEDLHYCPDPRRGKARRIAPK